ncbi:hypothetical protein [Thiorhodospira sibirica]|uniref:hypothetical protein n=1 Tax=Thiorhodospira sibirica TaxID=154347 RepID=UPI00022C0B47|nr:hypothetical protein [Thiorhodospira sibirica]
MYYLSPTLDMQPEYAREPKLAQIFALEEEKPHTCSGRCANCKSKQPHAAQHVDHPHGVNALLD